jgi:energy-coupling factor transport system ATP-binding protein
VLDGVDLTVSRGSVTTLMGRNGAGKSTLLGAVAAQHRLAAGRVRLGAAATDPHATPARDRVRTVGLVPQQPEMLLYSDTVAGECAAADADFGAATGTCRALLDRISGGIDADTHPRDLSEGQRLEPPSRSSCPGPPRCSCSTNRRGDSTTAPRRGSVRC